MWSVPRTAAMGVHLGASRWPLLPAPGGTHALAGSPRTTRMKRFLVVALWDDECGSTWRSKVSALAPRTRGRQR